VRLLAVFQFIFGCRHRHLSRVFTIKQRTYNVCFDSSTVDGNSTCLTDPLSMSVPTVVHLQPGL